MPITTFSSPKNVQLGDTILINRGGVSYHVDVTELADKADDDDLLLVNYDGASYRCRYGDIDNGADNAIVLVNRAGSSYYTTLGDLRGALGQALTFSVKLTSPCQAIQTTTSPGCPGGVRINTAGAVVTALITADSNASYAFETFSPGGAALFKVASEWMLCAGGAGCGFIRYDSTNPNGCNAIVNYNTSPALPFSAAGVKDLSPGSGAVNYNVGSFTYYSFGSGSGCPGSLNSGANGSPGQAGYSQYRTNAEESGDTYNGVKIENALFTANPDINFSMYPSTTNAVGAIFYEITYNGITKFYNIFNSLVTGDLPTTGIVGDLLTWS